MTALTSGSFNSTAMVMRFARTTFRATLKTTFDSGCTNLYRGATVSTQHQSASALVWLRPPKPTSMSIPCIDQSIRHSLWFPLSFRFAPMLRALEKRARRGDTDERPVVGKEDQKGNGLPLTQNP